jgi:hypothetical protein
VLIVWDRIFGTFVEEQERRDVYGLAKPLGSFDPLLANYQHALRMMGIRQQEEHQHDQESRGAFNVHYFLSVFFTHRHNHRFVCEPIRWLRALLLPSAWTFSVPPSRPWKTREKFGTAAHNTPLRAVAIYTSVTFLAALLLLLQLLLQHQDLPYYHAVILMVSPLWSLVSIGMLNECHPYSLKTETRRVLVTCCWLLLFAALKTVASSGYDFPSGQGVVGVKAFNYVVFLEAPFFLSDELLTPRLCVMYAVMIFALWMAARNRIRRHYRIVREPSPHHLVINKLKIE